MSRRKGRDRRRFIKKKKLLRDKLPIFNGYNLKEKIGFVMQVRVWDEANHSYYTVIGELLSYKLSHWNPNYNIAYITLREEETTDKYSLCDVEKCKGKDYWDFGVDYMHGGKYGKPCRIKRMLTKYEALTFKLGMG